MSVLKSTLKLTLLDQVSGRARRIGGVLKGLQRQQMAVMAPLRGITGQLLAFGGAYLGATRGIDGTIGSAIRFQDAFADVRKVIDGTDGQMDNIRRSIIDLSKELPTSASGIAEIYAAAGQANIPMRELNKFAEMTAKVAVAWDTTERETGQALAEIKNQLNLSVSEVGLFADALNHLSNNSAASAPRLLEFSKRVAANGEMFGFTSQQSLAFGGAMIATGAQADVAATSFRNMGRALTKGGVASKRQKDAMKKLGLDAVKTAKSMQKNALKTTIDVIEKIQSLPEWQRISVAGALFGDEARGLMPVINNATELRRQLGLVGEEANFAGSAFEEYVKRSQTVGNTLAILRNKLADVFRGIGDDMLPGLRDAALGIGDVIDTLGERATIFDQMKAALQGFAQGFGIDGDLRSLMNDIGDFFFGSADGSEAADTLGRIFRRFEEWGGSIRSLTSAINESPITGFLKSLSGYGVQLALTTLAIGGLASVIFKLAGALYFLSGAKAAVGILKALGKMGGVLGVGKLLNGKPSGGRGKTVPTARPKGAPNKVGGGLPGILGLFAALNLVANAPKNLEESKANGARINKAIEGLFDSVRSSLPKPQGGSAVIDGISARLDQVQNNGPWGKPMATDAIMSRIEAAHGKTQDVRITNRERPNVTVTVNQTIHEASDAALTAALAGRQVGNAAKEAVESSYSD